MSLLVVRFFARLEGPRCALYFVAFYFTLGVFIPFWPVWLDARGLDAGQIAVLGAVLTGTRILTAPVIGSWTDRIGHRILVLSGLAGAALIAFLGLGRVQSFPVILVLTGLFAIPWTAIGPLGENSAALGLRRRGLDYARIRLWGSLAFIGGTVGMAQWLAGRSDDSIHTVLALGMAVVVMACLMLPPVHDRPAHGIQAGSVRRLLAVPGLPLLFLAAAAIQASHGFYYIFGTLHWRHLALTDWQIGWLWSTGVVAEILLFAFAGPRLHQVSTRTLLLAAGGGAMLRWLLTGWITWPVLLFPIQVLHAMSFGLCHLVIMHYMVFRVPAGLTATGQVVFTALAGGVFMGLATLVSGPLFQAFGGGGYWAMAALAGLGMVCALALRGTTD